VVTATCKTKKKNNMSNKIFLLGTSEQGCGFTPYMAFHTEEERKEYMRVQDELAKQYGLNSWDGILDETEEIEFGNIDELRARAKRRFEYKLEQRSRMKNSLTREQS
jgi:hypothetical protein